MSQLSRAQSLNIPGNSIFEVNDSAAAGIASAAMPTVSGFGTSVASRYPCPANVSLTSAREFSDSQFPSQGLEPTIHRMSKACLSAHVTSAACSAAGSKVGAGRNLRDWWSMAGSIR